MPKPCSPKEEAELEMIRKVAMETFRDYKRAIEKIDNNKPGKKYKEKETGEYTDKSQGDYQVGSQEDIQTTDKVIIG